MGRNNKNHEKKKSIIKNYDATAFFYDKRYKKIQFNKFKQLFTNIENQCQLILDAGCGTGLLVDYLFLKTRSSRSEKISYVGIDISKEMIMHFLHKIKKHRAKECGIQLLVADLDNLPFRKEAFDNVYSFTSLQNLPHIIKGLEELLSMAKQGGNYKISILKKKIRKEAIKSFFEKQKELVSNTQIIDKEDIEDYLITFTK